MGVVSQTSVDNSVVLSQILQSHENLSVDGENMRFRAELLWGFIIKSVICKLSALINGNDIQSNGPSEWS